jgi:hypothetical protein
MTATSAYHAKGVNKLYQGESVNRSQMDIKRSTPPFVVMEKIKE